MILAAGMGSRLKDLTLDKPKALVEYGGKTLLEIIIRRLIHHGFRDIIINTHHFSNQIIKFIESKRNFGVNIAFSNETNELLETGGGIKNAMWFFENDPVLIHNVDVYTDLNLEEIYNFNSHNQHIATFAVSKRSTTRPFLMNSGGMLCGWENLTTGAKIITRDSSDLERIAYSCIAILSPEFIKMMPTGKYSLTDAVLEISKTKDIYLFPHEGTWKDMGRRESYDPQLNNSR